jgi:hypothetical protein
MPNDVADRFFREGKLTVIPAKRGTRRLVLATLAAQFEAGRDYSEDEVNRLLVAIFADFCTLRRALVDEGFLTRSATGSAYRRAE